jgi:biopolymer transport protein ExbD
MPLKTIQDEPPALNLTPMIDVVLMLIVFFLVGTEFTDLERRLKLEVPSVANHNALQVAPAARVVNVYQDGKLTLDREEITLYELTRQLAFARSQYGDQGVIVRGDGSGRVDRIVEVLNACRRAGVDDLGISVRIGETMRR